MKRALFVFILCTALVTATLYAATADRPMLLRVDLQDKVALQALASGGYDIAYVEKGKFAEVVADDLDYQNLLSAGFKVEIIHQDLVSFYQSRFPLLYQGSPLYLRP